MNQEDKKIDKINFKKWAFRFTIWVIVINVVNFYLVINFDPLGGGNATASTFFYLGTFASALLLMSFVFLIISSIKKEGKNYQFWISAIGLILFGVIPFIESII